MKAKMGTPAAITATAHKLARLVYSVLKYGTEYLDAGQDYYERQYKRRVINNLIQRAKQLGYQLLELKPDNTAVGVDQPNALQAVTR